MPARMHRDGAALEEWKAERERHKQRLAIARESVKSLSGHTLVRLDEAAEMLAVTKKTLREWEREGHPDLPPRVTLSPKVTGYRLMDLEALIDGGMVPRGLGAGE